MALLGYFDCDIGVGILNLIARCISYFKRNLKVVKEEDNTKVKVSRNIDNRLDKTIISVFEIRGGKKKYFAQHQIGLSLIFS